MRCTRPIVAALLASTALVATPLAPAGASDATWLSTPASDNLLSPANWSTGVVPNGTATFDVSSITTLQAPGPAAFGTWRFTSNLGYTINVASNMSFNGAGIINTGTAPRFAIQTGGYLQFYNNSSAGAATITTSAGGIVELFDNSTAGTASITNNGLLRFTGRTSAGSATITSTAELSFAYSSSAATATITNENEMRFVDSASASASHITNRGTLDFRNLTTADRATINNESGVVNFRGTSTASAATIGLDGMSSLNFYDQTTAAAATITTVNGASVTFNDASTADVANIQNAGSLEFWGTSTAGQATIDNTGSVSFYNSSSADMATITNRAGGALTFSDTSTAGSATISNEVTSTINFYNISSAGNATIANNGALFFRNDSTAGTATISGSGVSYFLNNSSTGNATITTNGAVFLSTYDQTGAATVTIQSGGALIGYGSVGNTTIQSGGAFGAAGGTLRINGNLIVGPGSLYGAGAIYGVAIYGLTDVTGTAAIGGARLYVAPPTGGFSFQTGESFTALTAAGGVTGTFSLEGLSPLISVLYGTNDVTITIAAYRVGAALGGAGGSNARSVGAALDHVIDASGGAPPSYFNPLLTLHGASLGNAMNGLSGEAAAGAHASAFTSASTFLGIMLDPMAGARGATAAAPGSSLIQMADTGRTPAARVAAGWSVWTKSFGQAGRTASDAATGAAGAASSLYGVAAGADRLISPDTLIGFALAGGGTAYGLGTRGTGSGDFAQVGLYGSTRLGPGYVSAALAYGWNRFDISRTAGLGPLETYRSAPTVHTFGGRIEAGRRFGDRAFAATPYAAVEAIGASTAGYRESWGPGNTGAFALTYGARTYATARAEAGVRLDSLRAVAQTADLLTFARLAYGFQAGTQRRAEASFQQMANSGFTVFGARASTHTALGSLGLELRLASGTRVTASLDGELGDRHRSLRANAGISHSW